MLLSKSIWLARSRLLQSRSIVNFQPCYYSTTKAVLASSSRNGPRRRKRPVLSRYDDMDTKNKTNDSNGLWNNDEGSAVVAREAFVNHTPSQPPEHFVPTMVNEDGERVEVSMDEYLKQSSLISPWVPCPEPVGRKMLELAEVTPEDVHYELGCGDGRVNFIAYNMGVSKTVGIDMDESMIQQCQQRLHSKYHPSSHPHVEFRTMDIVSQAHELVQEMNSEKHPCTVLTLYFVPEALEQIQKPILEQLTHVRSIISCGYPIPGWEPAWVEIMLGLPIYSYRKLDMDEEETEIDVPESNELAYEMLRAQQDMEEDFNPFISPSAQNKQQQDEQALLLQQQEELEKIDNHWDDFDDDDDNDDDVDTKK